MNDLRDDGASAGGLGESAGAASDLDSRTLLFLCSGNYYRSRFAELLFNARASAARLPWKATSAGLLPRDLLAELGPISSSTVERLCALGIPVDPAPRGPRPVSLGDFETAHRVVAVKEAEHRPLIRKNFPDWEERVTYWTVHDVDVMPPGEALPILEKAVLELLDELTGN